MRQPPNESGVGAGDGRGGGSGVGPGRPELSRHESSRWFLVARWLIRLASVLMPARDRADWRAEWESELWHEARRLRESGESAKSLVLGALGAIRDAVAARRAAGAIAARRAERGPGTRSGVRGGAADPADRGDAAGRADGGIAPDPGRRLVTARAHAGRDHPSRTEPGEAMMRAFREVRLALRALARQPAFAATAALVLALGIGTNAALFTIVDSVLLRPLPYPASERLVRIGHPVPGLDDGGVWGLSAGGYFYMLENNRSLDGLAVYANGSSNLSGEAEPPERVRTVSVAASMFDVLRASPVHGRLIRPEDNAVGAATVAVLGHGFWTRRYGADPSVVGRTLRISGRLVEIVGVAPENLHPPERPADVWLPLWLDPEQEAQNSHYLNAIGRLRGGVDAAAAEADLLALTARFSEAMPTAYTPDFIEQSRFTTTLEPLRDSLVGDAASSLWIVFGAVGVVLLIACVNVANLFLVRTEGRRREVAVRSALGASRGGLARLFLAESFVLVAVAGVAGAYLANAAVRGLLALGPSGLPRADEIAPGLASAGFTIALTIGAWLLFGLIPMLRLGRGVDADALRDAGGRVAAGRIAQRARSVLVAFQIAAALVLLAGAGVLGRSVQRMLAIDAGFDADDALVFDIVLPATYDTDARWNAFYSRLIGDIGSLSGVTAAGATMDFPLESGRGCWGIEVIGPTALTTPPCYPVTFVTPGYFAAAGIPIVAGRETTWSDNQSRTGAIVVSESFGRALWPNESALGKEIKIFTGEPPFYRIAGVAGDVRAYSLTEPHTPLAYFPIVPNEEGVGWMPPRGMSVVVRTTRAEPMSLAADVRRVLGQIDAEIPITTMRPVQRVVEESLAREDLVLTLLAIAAAVALLLGAVGLYGVIAYVVGQRRAEIGIRLALGARAAQVGLMILGQSLRIALAGLALGLAGALALTRLLESLLYEVSPQDPGTLAGVSAVLLAVLMVASWLPARRATRMDPAETLRAG